MSKTIALVGNPNCGKTTLFNELTGSRQRVGNWPGVTIECKTGQFFYQKKQIDVVDLPGIYQLSCSDTHQALDEKIACDFILNNETDLFINIIDAAHLERHLYLTLQLLTMKVPLIVAVNMMDVAKRRHIDIDLEKLQRALGCPVIGLIASKGTGISHLKKAIEGYQKQPLQHLPILYPEPINKHINLIMHKINQDHSKYSFCAEWLALQLLQDNHSIDVDLSLSTLIMESKITLEHTLGEELDIVFADTFYTRAHEIAHTACITAGTRKTITHYLDRIILNRFLGIPIFLGVMYCLFLFAINLGGAFQDFFDIASEAIFVQGSTQLLSMAHAPSWLVALLGAGFGKGINTTISFTPVIGAMFFFLAFLEGSGYMARASFVIDRFMRIIGLPGKSFVPMIIGFGCNVPAILAARTLDNPRDRTLTILMSPFMSCGARLAIFAVFTAAFFPAGGQNIVFALYFIGIVAAVGTGFILRKTLLKGELTPLVLELPAYHLPTIAHLLTLTWVRLKSFIIRAGKLIVPICMLIGLLNAVNTNGTLNKGLSSSSSILSSIGRAVTPILSPMGVTTENWPATVGLVTGVLAKEVVVATLNTLYTQEAHLTDTTHKPSVVTGIKTAVLSIPQNLAALKNSFVNPMMASAPDHTLNHQVYGVMYERFAGKTGAFAYLLFVLLYFPCISATAVMVKELNKKWTFFSVAWSTGIAYGVATSFYQLATFYSHPYSSFGWLLAIVLIFVLVLSIMKKSGTHQKGNHLPHANRLKTVR
ncbi:MAG: Fe(2+) transporter permease subunit FeoB [Gammaproteobacteria bacterium]|nr:Fe(2+) transporter permease subunit FeoB [Gammaproteobacteria bacterium]